MYSNIVQIKLDELTRLFIRQELGPGAQVGEVN